MLRLAFILVAVSLITLSPTIQAQFTFVTNNAAAAVTGYTGGASASLSDIVYDDLYRVTSLNSAARGLRNYAYNAIGNILSNQDAGAGLYQYGPKPHAVTNANGTAYGYDACGNMVTRGTQTLAYDEQNQLVRVSTGTTNVLFGYAEGGQRLWRSGTNGYSVWIGGIYEINNGKVLCHVFADGQRVATFEPICGSWAKVIGEERWYACSSILDKILLWPFQHGRSPWTFLAFAWLSIVAICRVAASRIGHQSKTRWISSILYDSHSNRSQATRKSHPHFFVDFRAFSWPESAFIWVHLRLKSFGCRCAALWNRSVTFASISALLLATTPTAEAQSYTPVFYYYYADHLGSSNVLTDRSGAPAEHYEYSTFGQSTYTSSTSAFPVSNRYTGQILDDETGLYYYNARYYDPQLGRFIQADTIVPGAGNPQNLNRYSYVGNNPLNATDPSGHGGAIGGFFQATWKAEANYWTSGNTWKNVGIGAAIGALTPAGPLAGAVLTLVEGGAVAKISAQWAYIAGPDAGKDAGFALSLAFALYGAYTGVQTGMIGGDNTMVWTAIGSAALGIAAASESFVGDSQIGEYLGYASATVAGIGAIEEDLEHASEYPEGTADVIPIRGVGERTRTEALPGRGNGWLDALDSVGERFGIAEDRVKRAAAIYDAIIMHNNSNRISTVFYPHSQGTLLTRLLLREFRTLGTDLSSTYVSLSGSPISKLEFAGLINLKHVGVYNTILDPIHNAFGAPWNPTQTAFGIMSLPFTIRYHNAVRNYGY